MYKFIVYKVTNLKNNKVYIGLTSKNLKERKRTHVNKAKRGINQPFLNAIIKYNEQLIWEEIAYCKSKEDAAFVERFNIELYKSNNQLFGYNLTAGGEGTIGLIPWNKGKPMLPHVAKILKEKRRNFGHLGKTHSPTIREKISLKVKNSFLKRGYGFRTIKIIVIDLNTGLPLFFNSINDACNTLKMGRKAINKFLRTDAKHERYDFSLDY